METKELKIQIPNGYEIDREKSTFEKIVFKPIDNKPRSWEEYCDNHKGDFCFIDNDANIIDTGTGDKNVCTPLNYKFSRNVLPNKELAEAFLAMMQLMSLRQAWIGNWEPDWKHDHEVFSIVFYRDGLYVHRGKEYSHPLSFPTKEMAEEFLSCFKDLIEQAKILL